MIKIIPAVLTSSASEVVDKISKLEGIVDRVQIDVIDGVFSNNKTIYPDAIGDLTTDLNIDYHLMVKEPINWVEKCVIGGADRIIAQIEMMQSQNEFVQKAAALGTSVGLAIDISTDIKALDPVVLRDLDVVLIMSVKAGFGGQEFDQKAFDKIKKLSKLRTENHFDFVICDDGGVSLENVDELEDSGVDEVAIGKRIFDGGNIKKNIDNLVKKSLE